MCTCVYMMCMCMCDMNSHSCVYMCACPQQTCGGQSTKALVITFHLVWEGVSLSFSAANAYSWHISLQRVSCLSFLCCWDTGITNAFSDIQLYLGAGNAILVLRHFTHWAISPVNGPDSLRYLTIFLLLNNSSWNSKCLPSLEPGPMRQEMY